MKVFAALRGFRNVWDHDEITEYLVDAKNYDSTTIDEIEHVNQRMPGSDGNRLREVLAWLDDEIAAV